MSGLSQPLPRRDLGPDLGGAPAERPLLPDPRGRAWDDNTLRAAWRDYLAAHGAPALTPRRARHTGPAPRRAPARLTRAIVVALVLAIGAVVGRLAAELAP